MNPLRLVQPQTAPERRISRCIFSRRDIPKQILLFGVVCSGIRPGVLGAGCLAACGSGPAGAGLCSLGAGRFGGEPEHPAAHGGQVYGEGVVPAIDAAVRGMEGFGLRLVRAAPAGGLSVQKFFGPGGEAQVERELFVGSVLGVHDAEDGLSRALAQPGVHALVPALAGHPLEAAGVILARVEGGLGGVKAAQSTEIFLECIVEGVETAEQVKLLKDCKCYLAQGFYFDRPLPVKEFEQKLESAAG